MNPLDEKEQRCQVLSRRQVLKALTATASAAILSTLPARWEKPVVRVGALPALAVVSPTPIHMPTPTLFLIPPHTPTPIQSLTPTSTPSPTHTPTPTPTPGIVTANMAIQYVGPCAVGGSPGFLYSVRIDYSDPQGNMVADQAKARFTFTAIPAGSVTDKVTEVTLSQANMVSANGSGTVTLPVCIVFGNATRINLTLLLIDASGANNSQGTGSIPKPEAPP